MGREIRNVPAGWEHPRYPAHEPYERLRDRYQPQFEQTRAQRVAQDAETGRGEERYFRPPEMAGGQHFQLYECTTEGTPLSDVFENREELLHHLSTQGDNEGRVWHAEAIRRIGQHGYITTGEAIAFGV